MNTKNEISQTNRRLNRLVVSIACLLTLPLAAFAQLPTPTYGWNLGNTLEPPSGEGTWAPAATQQLINSVAAAGFNTIRIPVAWDSHADRKGQIDPVWMARVQQVVGWCRAANLTAIINIHWDDGGLNSNSFGLFDRNTAALVDVDSARALTGGAALPPPGGGL
jgi:endoglucanase